MTTSHDEHVTLTEHVTNTYHDSGFDGGLLQLRHQTLVQTRVHARLPAHNLVGFCHTPQSHTQSAHTTHTAAHTNREIGVVNGLVDNRSEFFERLAFARAQKLHAFSACLSSRFNLRDVIGDVLCDCAGAGEADFPAATRKLCALSDQRIQMTLAKTQ